MRIGVLIPTRAVVMESARRPPVDTCWTMARRADQAGYDAVWVGDSIVAKPRLEALTKDYDCELVVSEAVTRRAGVSTRGLPRHELTLRNRAEPLAVVVVRSAAALSP